MKIPYFPGCSLKTYASSFEKSAIASGAELGIEFVEIPRWNCCGVVSSLTSDDLMHHLAPVRNMIRVLEMQNDKIVDTDNKMLTLCSMCMNTLKRSNLKMQEHADELETINDFMYKEDQKYDGSVQVMHYLEILKEYGFAKIAEKVKVSLKGLKVAPYYGCMLIRPKEVGIDDAEEPTIFEDFLKALGAEPVDWRSKKTCCGSYLTVNKENIVVKLTGKILEDARRNGADLIITSCPLCAFNLDSRQELLQIRNPNFEPIPVLYFSQLLAIALGLDINKFGFENNKVDGMPLLKNKILNK
ncbi:MAG: CoB--CoM heterodisulfide reductase iron-sulfur subunit B family protein [Candidatus Cloacimonetes bacterium]|nr:CoB--CoM heterodisulfide reductase iron-sulfur subunit B family protein [Candidatus Cloacimonadota bacterium]